MIEQLTYRSAHVIAVQLDPKSEDDWQAEIEQLEEQFQTGQIRYLIVVVHKSIETDDPTLCKLSARFVRRLTACPGYHLQPDRCGKGAKALISEAKAEEDAKEIEYDEIYINFVDNYEH